MTFTPRFSAKFGRGVPKHILKLIERDQVEALAVAQDDEDAAPLAPFRQFNRARPADPVLPAVSAYKRRVKDIEEAGDQRVESVVEWAIEVADEGPTEDAVMETLEIRVEAVDSILRADPDYLLQDLPPEIAGLVVFEITEHVYGGNVPDGKRHVRAAAITLQAKLFEV